MVPNNDTYSINKHYLMLTLGQLHTYLAEVDTTISMYVAIIYILLHALFIMHYYFHIANLRSHSLSTGAAVAITFAVTFILTLTVTAIITFIVTCICVKRTLDKGRTDYPKQQSPGPQEKVLYEQVCLPSQTVTKNDLELQPNPAYGTSHKVTMDTNPAYESCK